MLVFLTLTTAIEVEPGVEPHTNSVKQCKVKCGTTTEDAMAMFITCYGPLTVKQRENFETNYETLYPSFSRKRGDMKCQFNDSVIILPQILSQDISKTLNGKLGEETMHRYVNRLQRLAGAEPDRLDAVDCQKYLCSAKSQLKINLSEKLPEKVDLAENNLITMPKNQGECGSCWAFSSISLLENNVIYNVQQHIQRQSSENDDKLKENSKKDKKSDIPAIWIDQVTKKSGLDLSEQYLMSNTFGFSNYCDGGDFTTALNYFDKSAETIETETHYPYDPPGHAMAHKFYIRLPSLLRKVERYRPYKVFKNQMDKSRATPVVEIYYDPFKPFDEKAIQMVKAYLANGIPVIGAMYVGAASPILAAQGKTPVFEKCPKVAQNHQIIIVGYETLPYNGVDTECWKVKNSWGTTWGDDGFFYVPIGTNGFCMETYAFTAIPKEFDNSKLIGQ